MDFNHFVEWAFYGLMSATALYIASSISKLKSSVEGLNLAFATEIEKLSNVKQTIDRIEKTVDRHSDRLLELEKKTFNCSKHE